MSHEINKVNNRGQISEFVILFSPESNTQNIVKPLQIQQVNFKLIFIIYIII